MPDVDDPDALVEGGIVEGEDVPTGQGEQLVDAESPERRHRQLAAVA